MLCGQQATAEEPVSKLKLNSRILQVFYLADPVFFCMNLLHCKLFIFLLLSI
jgi:hypothetical protein